MLVLHNSAVDIYDLLRMPSFSSPPGPITLAGSGFEDEWHKLALTLEKKAPNAE